jgi:hypothetical protein
MQVLKMIKWTWLLIFKIFNVVIFYYQMFTHLWNLINLGQNLYQKALMSFIMMDVTWKSKKENPWSPFKWNPK